MAQIVEEGVERRPDALSLRVCAVDALDGAANARNVAEPSQRFGPRGVERPSVLHQGFDRRIEMIAKLVIEIGRRIRANHAQIASPFRLAPPRSWSVRRLAHEASGAILRDTAFSTRPTPVTGRSKLLERSRSTFRPAGVRR